MPQAPCSITLDRSAVPAVPAARIVIAHRDPGFPCVRVAAPLPALRAGTFLAPGPDAPPLLQVRSSFMLPGLGSAASRVVVADILGDLHAPSGPLTLLPSRRGLSLAWVTMSDKGSRGLREDTSGPLIAQVVSGSISLSLASGFILPDEAQDIRALLTDLALTQGYDLIVTTGGTGLAPRDVTADVTGALVEKRLRGFELLMLQASLAKTPHGAISRAVAGTLGLSLIVNLPGSPKAVAENLAPLLPAIPHALAKLQGDPADCAR
jgi:molybdenum cofactor synthesis domain-containing protein